MAEQKTYQHIGSLDLYGNGVGYDVAVVKRDDATGDLYFIKIAELDGIDKRRLKKIITSRNADNMELWDLMSQVTLKNGMNALEYFHQMVKIRTASGHILNIGSGGRSMPGMQQRKIQQNQQRQEASQKRGPGRPPKSETAKETSEKTE